MVMFKDYILRALNAVFHELSSLAHLLNRYIMLIEHSKIYSQAC